MTILYRLLIFFYQLGIRLAVPFNTKARQWVQGRKGIFEKISQQVQSDRPLIWVHCASLGEFEQGRPLIETIKKDYPRYRILLTFFSPSGYEIRKNYEQADYIFYLPADTPANARRFVSLVRPEKVFFVKYEFWPFYFKALKRANIPLFIVSAIFRGDQLFFRSGSTGRWYRKVLLMVDHFFVQNDESVELLGSLGLNNATRAGDTRFDRVAMIAANGRPLPLVEKFKSGTKMIVVGSSWKPDEDLIIQYINEHKGVKYIIAPHEIKPQNINRILSSLKKPSIRLSEADPESINTCDVLLIDSIGLLSSVYRYADLAYIGGGFGVGIHNTLEAAIFNIPVLFGPNYHRFNEAVMLEQKKVAYPVHNYQELKKTFDKLLSDDSLRAEISKFCRFYTHSNLGATQIITGKVFNN